MAEFTYDEAIELLSKNVNNITNTLEGIIEDIDYVKKQITTIEVIRFRITVTGNPTAIRLPNNIAKACGVLLR